MKKLFTDEGWDDYQYWIHSDKKVLKKINSLFDDIERNGDFNGIGQPESLKFEWSGWFSRRINGEHRLVYRVLDNPLIISMCKSHYQK